MKVSFLKLLRKHYEYKFAGDNVVVKNRTTGTVMEYKSIYDYVHSLSYVDMSIPATVSRTWNKKKEIIKTNRAVRDNAFWLTLA